MEAWCMSLWQLSTTIIMAAFKWHVKIMMTELMRKLIVIMSWIYLRLITRATHIASQISTFSIFLISRIVARFRGRAH